jgi:DeoR family transcriptional regulator, fructose operon transcriptional repressor
LYAEERQQRIVDRCRARQRVEVAGLAEELAVTSETIRRDLRVLEHRGVLRRVHGGAVPVDGIGFEPVPTGGAMTAEETRIARAALAELPEEGTILLDAGTTTARLADELPGDRVLTVVTHSVGIALTLTARPNLTVMLVGGRLRGRTLATVDTWALRALKDTFVEVAFLTTGGVSPARGLTTPDSAEAAIKRAAIGSARRCVLLADHTKVGDDHFTKFAALGEIDTVITDSGLDAGSAAGLAAAGPKVITA